MRVQILFVSLCLLPAFMQPDNAQAQVALHISDESATFASNDDATFEPDTECCVPCSCCCRPLWTLTADAVWLKRNRPDSSVLMQDTTFPNRNLNADDFGFDLSPGWAISLNRQIDCIWEFEFRYLGVDSWNAQAAAATNSTLLAPLQINTTPPAFAPNVQTINAAYRSELHNMEFNFHWGRDEWFSFLGGFRYIELDDHLHADLVTPVPTFTYDTTTQNRLYGFQLGGEAFVGCWGGVDVDATVKAGIYHNSGSHTSVLNTSLVSVAGPDTDDRTAFVGEVALHGTYSLTDNLSLRASYDLMWLDSVVLASDQVPATNFPAGRGIDSSGNVFYHGVLIGIEYCR